MTRQDKTRQDRTGQDKTRHEKKADIFTIPFNVIGANKDNRDPGFILVYLDKLKTTS
jgi:hypothetical protein